MNQRFNAVAGRSAALAAASVALAATGIVHAPLASAITPNTVSFPTKAQCIAAKPKYSNSFLRIVQDCTYTGGKFFGIETDNGPYILVYVARTS